MISTGNPYSAEHPVPPDKFAGRVHQISEFDRFLADTVEGNSKNLAILGGWGIGKTSLLRTFKYRAEQKNCTATIIELGESTDSFIALFETITQSLARDAARMKSPAAKVLEFLEGLSLSVNYGPVGISYYEKKKLAPNMLKFKEDLISISHAIDTPYLIMLDNAEQLLTIKGAIFELRNIFQMIQSVDNVRCMLILSGKETLFADMRSASEPAVRFFWGIELEPFMAEETLEAIEKPLKNSGIIFDDECMKKIFELTHGHPYFVQVFAYNLFSTRSGDRITKKDLEQNYNRILTYMGKRLFNSIYAQASMNERKILCAFLKTDTEMLSNPEIADLSGVKSANIYLKNMSSPTAPVLRRVERGKYALFHPLFKEYLKTIKKMNDRKGPDHDTRNI
jgi:hypothetical protein